MRRVVPRVISRDERDYEEKTVMMARPRVFDTIWECRGAVKGLDDGISSTTRHRQLK